MTQDKLITYPHNIALYTSSYPSYSFFILLVELPIEKFQEKNNKKRKKRKKKIFPKRKKDVVEYCH